MGAAVLSYEQQFWNEIKDSFCSIRFHIVTKIVVVILICKFENNPLYFILLGRTERAMHVQFVVRPTFAFSTCRFGKTALAIFHTHTHTHTHGEQHFFPIYFLAHLLLLLPSFEANPA